MLTFIDIIIILAVACGLAYRRTAPMVWAFIAGVVLLIFSILGSIYNPCLWWFLAPAWLIFISLAAIFNVPQLCQNFITKRAFNIIRQGLPTISRTEREALEAGDTWWEAELFRGSPDWQKLHSFPKPALTAEEQAFLDNQVETLCLMLDEWKAVIELKDLPKEVWNYLKKERFWGLVMSKEYGGLGFSALAHSTIIMKIASRSINAAVTVMVPNSLGPAELLYHYGTKEQKDHYLPRLAAGEEIPCFGLTGLEAGSDAGSMTDKGVVCMGEYQGKQVLGIRLSWKKRYITLAPIATLLGIAFKLSDPDHLLGDTEEIGITVCLIPTDHPGVETGRRHLPMNMIFMNGPTTGKDVFVPMDFVIGGQTMVGQGWRMLMECLSVGRSISLPALGASTAQFAYRLSGSYARIRKQFKVPIGQFEGVQEALARIAGFSYLLEAARVLTTTAVDLGVKPAVASAIAKYNMTEMGRKAMEDAMDIHGGRGIQMGPRNYLAFGYESMPISITVEGANILMRNLLVFGQGAMRCHPYIYQEIAAVNNPDSQAGFKQFDELLSSHLGYTVSNFAKSLVLGVTSGWLASSPIMGPVAGYYRQLARMSAALAFVSDIAMMILGGELKRKERLSARLGDVLSQLYLGSAVLKYYQDQGQLIEDVPYVHWSLQTCLHTIQEAFYGIFQNFPNKWLGKLLRLIVFPWGGSYKLPSDKLSRSIVKPMLEPSAIRERLTHTVFKDTDKNERIGRMEYAFNKIFEAQEADSKLKLAVRNKQIQKFTDLEKQLSVALEAQVLTEAEVLLLREAEAARLDAIEVDAFPKEFFTGGKQRNAK